MAIFGVPEQWCSVTKWFYHLKSQEYAGFPSGLVTSTGCLWHCNALSAVPAHTAELQQHMSSCPTFPCMSLPYGQPHSQRQGNSLGQREAECCGGETYDSLWNDIISTAANSAGWCWLQQAVKLMLLWEDRGTSSRIADASVSSSMPLQKCIYIVNGWVQWSQMILWVFLGSPIAYPMLIC